MSGPIFKVVTSWTAGGLTPTDIGQRTLCMLQQLGPLSPAMRNWLLLDRAGERYVTLKDATPRMAAFVERNVCESDFEGPDPGLGYGLYVKGSEVPSEYGAPDSINISMDVGGNWRNHIAFEVGDQLMIPDPASVTYPIYRGVLETIASVWPCPWVLAYSYVFKDRPEPEPWDGKDILALLEKVHTQPRDVRRPYATAWIAYLSPQFAKGLVVPPELVSEPTPNGGVILSAVQERLDEGNLEHMRRSQVLEAIMKERLGFARKYNPDDPDQAAEPPARVGPY